METKEIIKLVEAKKASYRSVNETESLTRGEHYLLDLFVLSLDNLQVDIERGELK